MPLGHEIDRAYFTLVGPLWGMHIAVKCLYRPILDRIGIEADWGYLDNFL